MKREKVFTRFERFWHWTQALLIILLMLSGFTVHGTLSVQPWGTAAELHVLFAWALIGLWAFAVFWHLTTGEWRQYLPTTDKLMAVASYYTVGIFRPGVEHPFKKTRRAKHNPLQRLAYLFFKLLISPALWISGLLYMYYNDISGLGLGVVAFVHTAAAFAMLVFFIAHVYMAFTSKPWDAYLKGMISGYEEVAE